LQSFTIVAKTICEFNSPKLQTVKAEKDAKNKHQYIVKTVHN